MHTLWSTYIRTVDSVNSACTCNNLIDTSYDL